MKYRTRTYYMDAQKALMWERWKAGWTLHQIAQLFNRGDVEAAGRCFGPAFVDHAPWPGQLATGAGFKAGPSELRSSFPDLRVAVERTVAQGDLGVGHYRMSGTQLGEFMGSAESGRTFDVDAIDIVRIQDGRILEHWGVIDEASMALRLGIAA